MTAVPLLKRMTPQPVKTLYWWLKGSAATSFRKPKSLKDSLRNGKKSLRKITSIFGRYRCPVCDHRVVRFRPLASVFPATFENIDKYSYCHTHETLNAAAYQCPFCEASDRERLYALYIGQHFAKLKSGEPVRVLEFAPVKCLRRYISRTLKQLKVPFIYRTADLYAPYVDDKVDIMDMAIYQDGPNST